MELCARAVLEPHIYTAQALPAKGPSAQHDDGSAMGKEFQPN